MKEMEFIILQVILFILQINTSLKYSYQWLQYSSRNSARVVFSTTWVYISYACVINNLGQKRLLYKLYAFYMLKLSENQIKEPIHSQKLVYPSVLILNSILLGIGIYLKTTMVWRHIISSIPNQQSLVYHNIEYSDNNP